MSWRTMNFLGFACIFYSVELLLPYQTAIICRYRHLLTKLPSLICSYRFPEALLHLHDVHQATVQKYRTKNQRGSRRKGLQPAPRLVNLKNDN